MMDKIILFIVTLILFSSIAILNNSAWSQQSFLITSTRNTFDLNNGSVLQKTATPLPNANSLLNIGTNGCPPEIAIYIHGIWATPAIANEQTERVYLSLKNLNYKNPIIGFSWDSDTPFSLEDQSISQHGWETAKIIANKNGPLLAKFVVDFKKKCPDSEVRLVAHSLGSRVVLSSLQSLNNDEQFANLGTNITKTSTSKIIKSVHLMGAAVDDEQLSMNPLDCISNIPKLECSGIPIEKQVEHFYNLYDTQDNMVAPTFFGALDSVYKITEDDDALGGNGAENILNTPNNYNQTNVIKEILVDIDANGDGECDLPVLGFGFIGCSILFLGDNHFGYMGYRDFDEETVYDEGVMDIIAADWRNEK
jgi:alpha/beta hydrolase family protein DUF900